MLKVSARLAMTQSPVAIDDEPRVVLAEKVFLSSRSSGSTDHWLKSFLPRSGIRAFQVGLEKTTPPSVR